MSTREWLIARKQHCDIPDCERPRMWPVRPLCSVHYAEDEARWKRQHGYGPNTIVCRRGAGYSRLDKMPRTRT